MHIPHYRGHGHGASSSSESSHYRATAATAAEAATNSFVTYEIAVSTAILGMLRAALIRAAGALHYTAPGRWDVSPAARPCRQTSTGITVTAFGVRDDGVCRVTLDAAPPRNGPDGRRRLYAGHLCAPDPLTDGAGTQRNEQGAIQFVQTYREYSSLCHRSTPLCCQTTASKGIKMTDAPLSACPPAPIPT